jgi:hypothetical protein
MPEPNDKQLYEKVKEEYTKSIQNIVPIGLDYLSKSIRKGWNIQRPGEPDRGIESMVIEEFGLIREVKSGYQ